MKEHLRKVVNGEPTAVVEMLRLNGVRVLHRFGDTLVVEGDPVPDLPGDTRRATQAVRVDALTEAPAQLRDEDIGLLAYRLRQTEAYRRTKEQRPDVGEDWGVIFDGM